MDAIKIFSSPQFGQVRIITDDASGELSTVSFFDFDKAKEYVVEEVLEHDDGSTSIDDVLDHVHSGALKQYLTECKKKHEELKNEIQYLLNKYHDDGKEPTPIAKGMSWMKTSMRMGMDHSDQTIADLMTDGCNMGVKSLNQYLNQYEAADEVSKDIAKRLINLEEQLTKDIRKFL